MQGAFAEHEASLDKLHIPHFEIRQADDLQDVFYNICDQLELVD